MRAFLRLLRYVGPYRPRMAAAIAFMVLNSVATTLSITLVGPFTRLMFAAASGTTATPPAAGRAR